MVKASKHFTPEQVKLTGRLSEFRDALQDEIKEIEKNGQNSTLLVGGHSIEASGSGFWYRFFVEYMPILPADTPCKLTVGTEQYDVSVIISPPGNWFMGIACSIGAFTGIMFLILYCVG